MDKIEEDFRIEDMKDKTNDQQIWREFVDKFGTESYLWLCKRVNGAPVYVPEIDTQLRPARLRAYPVHKAQHVSTT